MSLQRPELEASRLTFSIEPAVDYLAKRGWRRGAATGLVFVAVFVAIAGLIALLIPAVVSGTRQLITSLPDLVNNLARYLKPLGIQLDQVHIEDQVRKYGSQLLAGAGSLLGGVVQVATGIVGGVFQARNGMFVHMGGNDSFGTGSRTVGGFDIEHNQWGFDVRVGWHPGSTGRGGCGRPTTPARATGRRRRRPRPRPVWTDVLRPWRPHRRRRGRQQLQRARRPAARAERCVRSGGEGRA